VLDPDTFKRELQEQPQEAQDTLLPKDVTKVTFKCALGLKPILLELRDKRPINWNTNVCQVIIKL